MDTVSIIKCQNYDKKKLIDIIEKHFKNLGGIEKLIPKNSKVAVKPNLVMGLAPEKAATTHPVFLDALISIVKKQTDNIIIVESPGGPSNEARFKAICKTTGISALDCEIVYEKESVEIPCENGIKCRSFDVLKALTEVDVIISAAKLKTHGMMVFSGAAKNLFGAIYGLAKSEFHFRFSQKEDFANMLIDLCIAIKPSISLIDGIVGMEGNGPTGGNAKETDLTFAGLNPFATDFVAGETIGVSKEKSPLIYQAIERELCPDKIENINILGSEGEKIENLGPYFRKYMMPDALSATDVSFLFFRKLPKGMKRFIDRKFSPYPIINKDKCIGCQECYKSCPQKTIVMKDKKADIITKNCIRCFCCQELCPKHAVDVKRLPLFKI